MKRRNSKVGEKMEETSITLEEITNFYEKYGIAKDQQNNQLTIPSAFDDIPLVFSCSTQQPLNKQY